MVTLKYHLIGIQEGTHSNEMMSMSQDVIRIAGPGYGCSRHLELWANCKTPYAYEGEQPHRFHKDQFRVLGHCHLNGSWMVIRISTPFFVIDIVTGHSPHAGRPEGERKGWWASLTKFLHGRSKPTTRAGSRESWRWLRLTLARTRKIATPAWRAGAALHLRLQPAGLLANETHFLPFAIRAYAVWQTLYPFWT